MGNLRYLLGHIPFQVGTRDGLALPPEAFSPSSGHARKLGRQGLKKLTTTEFLNYFVVIKTSP